jgi:hypothetical protein
VRHLLPGVHAAVGAPRGGEADGLSGDLRQGGFDRVLDRAAARLRLPAEEAAAVVLDA